MTKTNDKPTSESLAERFVRLAAQAGATEGTCSALSDAVVALDRLTGRKNWRGVEHIDQQLSRLSGQVSGPVANLIGGLRAFTIDKSWRFFFSYALLLLLLTPVASYLLVLFLRIGSLANPTLFQSPEFRDLVKGVVSAALYLPLFLANKLNKTHRCPVIRPGFLPILLVLALLVSMEYLGAVFFFLDTDAFSASAFWAHARLSARTQWLYPLPLVVVSMNLLTAARFIRYSKETAEVLNNELGAYLRFVVIAIVAIAISAVIRVAFALVDLGEVSDAAVSAPGRIVNTTSRLNLRACPSTANCRVLQTLPKGARLHVVGERGEWLQVRLLEDQDQVGWVSGRYTEPLQGQ